MAKSKITNDEVLEIARKTLVRHHGKDWDFCAVSAADVRAMWPESPSLATVVKRLKSLVSEGKLAAGARGFYVWPLQVERDAAAREAGQPINATEYIQIIERPVSEMSKRLYKFEQDFRGGDLAGVFVATPEEVEAIMGTTISFGEVLGKHSDVDVEMDEYNLKEVTADSLAVEVFERYFGGSFGCCPLDYLPEEEDEESEEDDQ